MTSFYTLSLDLRSSLFWFQQMMSEGSATAKTVDLQIGFELFGFIELLTLRRIWTSTGLLEDCSFARFPRSFLWIIRLRRYCCIPGQSNIHGMLLSCWITSLNTEHWDKYIFSTSLCPLLFHSSQRYEQTQHWLRAG